MGSVTIEVASRDVMTERMRRAFAGETVGSFITFPSVDLLWSVLKPERWHLLELMTGKSPLRVVEIATLAGRGVEAVGLDVEALVMAGVVDREADGKVVFPFDAIHVDFILKAA